MALASLYFCFMAEDLDIIAVSSVLLFQVESHRIRLFPVLNEMELDAHH